MTVNMSASIPWLRSFFTSVLLYWPSENATLAYSGQTTAPSFLSLETQPAMHVPLLMQNSSFQQLKRLKQNQKSPVLKLPSLPVTCYISL